MLTVSSCSQRKLSLEQASEQQLIHALSNAELLAGHAAQRRGRGTEQEAGNLVMRAAAASPLPEPVPLEKERAVLSEQSTGQKQSTAARQYPFGEDGRIGHHSSNKSRRAARQNQASRVVTSSRTRAT